LHPQKIVHTVQKQRIRFKGENQKKKIFQRVKISKTMISWINAANQRKIGDYPGTLHFYFLQNDKQNI